MFAGVWLSLSLQYLGLNRLKLTLSYKRHLSWNIIEICLHFLASSTFNYPILKGFLIRLKTYNKDLKCFA